MKFIPTQIPDVRIIEPRIFQDGRGYFFESFRRSLFSENGIPEDFQQDNQSCSSRGVLRGLHYQIPPQAQSKLIRVVRGAIFDVAVDVRKGSPTFGQYVGVCLDAKDKKMLYIPPGFAHGYLSLEDHTEVLYKVSNQYSPQHERGIIWNDPAIGIKWPKLNGDYLFSEKDQKYPALKDAVTV